LTDGGQRTDGWTESSTEASYGRRSQWAARWQAYQALAGDYWVTVVLPNGREARKKLRTAIPNVDQFAETYRSQLREVEDEYSAELDRLSALDVETRARIRPAVVSAAVTCNLRWGWAAMIDDLIENHFALVGVGVVLFCATFIVPMISWFAGAPTTACWFWSAVVVVVAQTLIGGLLRLARRYGNSAELTARLLVMISADVTALHPWLWRPRVHALLSRWHAYAWFRDKGWHLSEVHPSFCLINAGVAVIMIGSCPFLNVLLRVILVRFGPQDSRETVACARIADGFFEIALFLEDVINPIASAEGEGLAESNSKRKSRKPTIGDEIAAVRAEFPAMTSFLVNEDRRALLRSLERLARQFEGPWRRAVMGGDTAAKLVVNRIATGAATAIRRWKPVAVVGGSGLEEMRRAFALAVVNIADDEWEVLAADAAPREVLGRRLIRMARRIAATALMLGVVPLVLLAPSSWHLGTNGLGAMACFMGILVALGLDPSLGDRYELVSKLANVLPGRQQLR
jgi:hypothetical protein